MRMGSLSRPRKTIQKSMSAGLLKKASNYVESKSKTEKYPLGYVESLNDGCENVRPWAKGLFWQSGWEGVVVVMVEQVNRTTFPAFQLGSSLRRGTIRGALQIHIEQNGAAWFFGTELDRHPIDDQFDQGHRNDMRRLI